MHPVVFLHAGVADSRMWAPQVEAFSRHFKVVTPEVRDFAVDDLRALVDELGVERTHLVACSMGGAIAIDFALEHPERVARLVLVGSAVRGYRPREEFTHVFAEERAARKSGDLDAVNQALMRTLLDGPSRPRGHVAQPLRDLFTDMNMRALRANDTAAPANRTDWLAIDRLGEIAAPTLVVVGDSDAPHVLDIAERLLTSIPHARKAVIRDAAHLPNLEHPDEFNRVVLDFLLAGGG